MSNYTIPVFKFMFKDDFQVLSDALKVNPPSDLYEQNSSRDLALHISTLPAALVMASVRTKDDLVQIASFMKTSKRVAKDCALKIVVINFSLDRTYENAISKLGIQDVLEPKISAKGLRFKLDFWMKSLTAQAKLNGNVGSKENKLGKGLEGKQETFKKDAPSPNWTPPLELEDDIWIIKNESEVKKILGKWLIRILGPGPYVGSWYEVQTSLWRFDLKESQKEMFVSNEGSWYFSGEQRPDFVWKENNWLIAGENFELFFKNDNGEFSRLKAKDKILTVCKNSLFAETKGPVIIASFDKYFVVKREAENLGNLEGENKTENIQQKNLELKNKTGQLDKSNLEGNFKSGADKIGNLQGKTKSGADEIGGHLERENKTENIQQKNLEGKNKAGQLDQSNLEGNFKNGADKSGNLQGKTKSGADEIGGNLESENKTENIQQKNLEGKNKTDQLDQSNLEGKSKSGADRSGNLQGKTKSGADEIDGNLKSQNKTENIQQKNLEEKNKTGQLDQSNLEGKTKSGADRSGNLQGKTKSGADEIGGNLKSQNKTENIQQKNLEDKHKTGQIDQSDLDEKSKSADRSGNLQGKTKSRADEIGENLEGKTKEGKDPHGRNLEGKTKEGNDPVGGNLQGKIKERKNPIGGNLQGKIKEGEEPIDGNLEGTTKTGSDRKGRLEGIIETDVVENEQLDQKALTKKEKTYWDGNTKYEKDGKAEFGVKTDEEESAASNKSGQFRGKSSTDEISGYYDNSKKEKPEKNQRANEQDRSQKELSGKSYTDKISGHLGGPKEKSDKEAPAEKQEDSFGKSSENLSKGNKAERLSSHYSNKNLLERERELTDEEAKTFAEIDKLEKAQKENPSIARERAIKEAKEKLDTIKAEKRALRENENNNSDLSDDLDFLRKAKIKQIEDSQSNSDDIYDRNQRQPGKGSKDSKEIPAPQSREPSANMDNLKNSTPISQRTAEILPLDKIRQEKAKEEAKVALNDAGLEELTKDAKVVCSVVIKGKKLQCEITDYFDDTIIFITKDRGAEESTTATLDMAFKSLDKVEKLILQGNVTNVDNDGEGSFYISVQLSKENSSSFDSFMRLYETRQANVSEFLRRAKGY